MYRPLPLLALIAMCALLTKIYQHNRLVHLTYDHQKLSLQHSQVMQECMNLRAQHVREANIEKVYDTARRSGLQPLSTENIVPLSSVKT